MYLGSKIKCISLQQGYPRKVDDTDLHIMTTFGLGALISEEFYYKKFRKTQESKFKWLLKKQIRLICL